MKRNIREKWNNISFKLMTQIGERFERIILDSDSMPNLIIDRTLIICPKCGCIKMEIKGE